MPTIGCVAPGQTDRLTRQVPPGRIMPSLPDIPVVTVAPGPMIIQVASVSTGDRTPLACNNSIRPELQAHSGGRCVMVRRTIMGTFLFLSILAAAMVGAGWTAKAAGIGKPNDWDRFNYYPATYYRNKQ